MQRRSQARRTLAVVLYFAVVWYLISDIPLLVASFEARHLYLLAVGPCIATAFLAMPPDLGQWKEARYVRWLGAGLLVVFSACQLWKDNAQFVRSGEMSARATTQMAAMMGATPKQTLVIVQFREEEFLPFVLQEPFTSADLYSRVRIIEFSDMCDCSLPQWREKTKQILGAELAGAPDVPLEINLLAWDEQSQSLLQRKRVLPRGLIQACVTESLGGPVDSLDSVGDAKAYKLVEALGRLVLDGR